MRRLVISILLLVGLTTPSFVSAQSGDASWLESLDGLESGVGRSWMGEIVITEELTETEFNEQGTPVHEISMITEPLSTPEITDEHQTMMLSVFVFQFDSEANAAAGLEKLNAEQMDQHSRDPRSPAVEEFDVEVGDAGYGWKGEIEIPTIDNTGNMKMGVVYLMVQDGDLVYQLFGQFVPGYGEEVSRQVVTDMVAAEVGSGEPVFEPNGGSTGGLWEKLNAVDVAFPEGVMTFDLQIWPMDPNAVQGQSVTVPMVDLDALGEIPGLTQGWHASYGESDLDPKSTPEGVYSIELWVLEFDSVDNAMATAFSVQEPLLAPLGIISGDSFGEQQTREAFTLNISGSGFVRDRSLPEGDAAFSIILKDNTLVFARVYSNGPAPSAVVEELTQQVFATPLSETAQDDERLTGGGWDRFPQPESDAAYGLPLKHHEYVMPAHATPVATPE